MTIDLNVFSPLMKHRIIDNCKADLLSRITMDGLDYGKPNSNNKPATKWPTK